MPPWKSLLTPLFACLSLIHSIVLADDSTLLAKPADLCSVVVQVDDTLRMSPASIEVPDGCEEFDVLLRHVGRLPKVATPRNWVLTRQEDANGVASDAELAGAKHDWLKQNDRRVLAASSVIGRGESVRVSIPLKELVPGVQYTYLSTIPGFSPVLRGTLTVKPSAFAK